MTDEKFIEKKNTTKSSIFFPHYFGVFKFAKVTFYHTK